MDAVTFHESDDRLELYALNRLPDSDTISIEEHLLLCDSCRDRVDEIGAFAQAMREAFKSQPVAAACPGWLGQGWFGWLKPQFAMAGALSAVVLAVWIYWTAGNARVASVASMQLTAMRGGVVPTVNVAKELDLTFPKEVGVARIDVVDANGGAVWSGSPVSGSTVEVKVQQTLSPGDYYARLSSGTGTHEYLFRVVK